MSSSVVFAKKFWKKYLEIVISLSVKEIALNIDKIQATTFYKNWGEEILSSDSIIEQSICVI